MCFGSAFISLCRVAVPERTDVGKHAALEADALLMSHRRVSTYSSACSHAYAYGHMRRCHLWLIYTLSNQTLTHNKYTVWLNAKAMLHVVCQHESVCPILSVAMCNEVAEASIQQFSIYELLTLERRDLNVTPS